MESLRDIIEDLTGIRTSIDDIDATSFGQLDALFDHLARETDRVIAALEAVASEQGQG